MSNKKLEFEDIEYLVFEGGGALGTAYLGALCALQDLDKKNGRIFPGLLNNNEDYPNNDTDINSGCIKGVSGSSIGAIIALCVSLGYSAEEINVRLITDRAFSILGKEDIMSDITRYYKPKNCKEKAKNKINPKTDWQELWTAIKNSWFNKKILNDLIDLPSDLFGSFLKNYILTSFENPDFFTNNLYKIIGESIYEHRSKIYTLLYMFSISDKIFPGTNLMPFYQMFQDKEQFDKKIEFYTDWIENKKWNDIENYPSKTAVKDFTLIAISIIALSTIAFVLISKLFKKKDIKQNNGKQMYQTSMILRSLVLVLSTIKNNQVNSIKKFVENFNKKVVDGNLFKIIDTALDFINDNYDSFFEGLESISENLWKTISEPTVSRVINSLFKRGGIFPGETVDIVLAELIYSKVEVIGEGNAAKFKKRLIPYDFTNIESRKKHPLFSDIKLVRKVKNKSKNDIDDVYDYKNEINDFIYKTYKDYYDTIKEKRRKEIKKNDRKKINQYWKDITTIINHFTFDKFHNVFENINLVVTGSNILQGVPVYFNYSLTPNFPITKAVGISSCFPMAFRPILVQCYDEDIKCKGNYSDNGNSDNWIKNNKEWYQANYNGWFIDGGWLNNFPINAFNYENNVSSISLSPLNMMNEIPCSKVLSFRLGGVDIDDKSKQKELYEKFNNEANQYKSPSLGKLSSMMLDSIMSDSTNYQILSHFEKNQQVISLYTGYISVLDMTINEKHIIEVDSKSYTTVMKRFSSYKESESEKNELIKRLRRGKEESKRWRRTHTRLINRPVSRDRKYQENEIKK
ncbi:MAG: patatin-like phospholipase family protein [Bacteroidetes bacterium]|nr:patatin-like phospholipase family protein [Flavobacteriaceae bacterium]MCB0536553.1 patatin-like phospholipase family protein [Bacteroidota bacterium]